MSDRDELAATIRGGGWPSGSEHFYADDAADAVIDAGWRKKPSREEVIDALNVSDPIVGGSAFADVHWGAQADAVLALLDGPTETGEK